MNQNLCEIIRTRRSIRRYDNKSVPRALIEELLQAAHWAPSAHNRQPWRFAIIEAVETKHALATAMGAQLRADLEREGTVRELIEAKVARSYARITAAPVVIIACATTRNLPADTQRQQTEWLMAAQSVAAAVQNLLLAAHVRGLGTCWMGAPLFALETVCEVLQLDADWEPQALITLGYPAEAGMTTRTLLETVVKYLDANEDG